MASGKEIQLYSDIGKSQPAYPKTNAKCVFYDDGTRLDRMIAAVAGSRNLLNNSDFTRPVNQRGATSYSAQGYTIDRWMLRTGGGEPVTIEATGIRVAKNSDSDNYTAFKQPFNVTDQKMAGKTVTFVANIIEASTTFRMRITGGASDTADSHVYTQKTFDTPGVHFVTYTLPNPLSNNYLATVISLNDVGNVLIEWAALYEGTYTADTLPEYQPKGYEQELLICNQYDPVTDEYIGLRKFNTARNLLDNSDFSNPVNQRGGTSYTPPAASYWLDKWASYGKGTKFALTNKKLTLSNNGSATCGLFQRVPAENLTVGKTYTLAVKGKVTGTWYLTYGVKGDASSYNSTPLDQNVDKVHVYCFTLAASTDGLYNFRFRAPNAVATAEIEWMALYEGVYSADTLPEYQSKGKQVEALNCGAIPGPIDLMWQNASPTSEFAAQTVAVDLSLYNWVLIEAIYNTEYSERATMLTPITNGAEYSITAYRASSTTVTKRLFTPSKTGIAFENGTSGSSSGSKYLIPVKIYGVKG